MVANNLVPQEDLPDHLINQEVPENDLPNNTVQNNNMNSPFYQWTVPGLKAKWQGLKQGGREIGQGVEQAGAWVGKLSNLESPENYEKLTNRIKAQRDLWEQTQGQNPESQKVKNKAAYLLPFLTAAIPFAGPELTIANVLKSAGAGAALGGTQYVPPGGSRLGNTIMGGAEGAALPIAAAGVRGLSGVAKALFSKHSPEKTASIIQNGHDFLQNSASDLYNTVEKEAEKRGINKLPIPNDLIEESRRFFSNDDASRNLIDKAKTGDYKSIRKLQSDLGKRAQKFKSSDMSADWDKGDEAFDTRDKINKEVENTFNVFGHPDLNEKLSQANNIYRNMKDTYYSDPTIGKLVNPESRKVPDNINKKVKEISIPMEKVRAAHPELMKEVEMADKKKQAIKLLKSLGYMGGAAEVWRHGEDIHLLKSLLGSD